MSSVIEYERGGADQFQQEGIPNHTGEPRAKPADFFAPPPPEIRQVLTAESSLAPGRRAMPVWLRLAIAGIIAAGLWGGTTGMGQSPQVAAHEDFPFSITMQEAAPKPIGNHGLPELKVNRLVREDWR